MHLKKIMLIYMFLSREMYNKRQCVIEIPQMQP